MKTRIVLSISFLACLAANANASSDPSRAGFFVGAGTGYNSVNINQASWGKGVSTIVTSTGTTSNGVGQGNGAPFNNINNGLAPAVQAGYFQHIGESPNLVGIKFIYESLNSNATNANLYIPQLGQTTNADTGVTSPLVGYVNADSVQPSVNQQLMLLLFAGRSFGNAFLYAGAGPAVVNMQSKNYYSIGYANFEGATINVTGLVSYSSQAFWAWGGAAQLGASYFFSPSWFVDMSYTYTLIASTSVRHQQTFTNTSELAGVTYTTSGTLYTKDTLGVTNQTLMLTVNKVFDL